jgi:hypothetical protein
MGDISCVYPFVFPYYLRINSFVYQNKTLGVCVLRNAKLWTTDMK